VLIATILIAVVLIALGVPVGLSLIGATLVGFSVSDPIQLQAVVTVSINSVNDSTLVAIPLFVMAGAVIAESGFMDSLLEILAWLLRPIRGGLVLACLGTALFFAGSTGSTAGEAASLSGSFFGPMKSRGYSPPLTAAIICASAAAGVLLPPSVTLIVYGTIASYPVTNLWLAGVVPALMSAVLLGLVGVLLARKSMTTLERPTVEAITSQHSLAFTLTRAFFALGLPVVVLGGIYSGILTVTETAAVSIVYVLVFGVIFNHLNIRRIYRAFNIGAERAALIFLVFIGAHVLNYYLSLAGVLTSMVNGITNSGLPRPVLLILLDLLILLMGSIMDGLSVLIVATPLLFPLLGILQLSPVQLGVMLCLAIEIGVVHPPIGLNLFAVSSVTKLPVGKIALSVIPFVAVLLTMLMVVTFAPLPIFAWH
jgi:C4-dicarboxylate transporter, DctM subunit